MCNTCKLMYVGQTSHSLKIRFQEHIRYIRSNNPQSAFTLHILQNQHKYGHMNNIMTLLKPLNSPNMLIPYEQYYIQALYWEGKLIPKQYLVETNPLFQTVINPQPLHTTWIDQLCFSRQPDTTLAELHPNTNTQQSKVCTISDTQHQQMLAAHHVTYPIMYHTTCKNTLWGTRKRSQWLKSTDTC